MPSVKLFANLRKIAGAKEMSIPGENLGQVLSKLIEQHPALGAALLEGGQVRPYVIITINGQHAPAGDLTPAVTEQDEIAIFPPITGG